eukprot:GHVL01016581.1.p1 GENE.GHVL01016581.1~~GHVL01016581.1.p1  ORF type:complete len:108 (+),score=16.86 GHVL01016581.1:741-1064(+)
MSPGPFTPYAPVNELYNIYIRDQIYRHSPMPGDELYRLVHCRQSQESRARQSFIDLNPRSSIVRADTSPTRSIEKSLIRRINTTGSQNPLSNDSNNTIRYFGRPSTL